MSITLPITSMTLPSTLRGVQNGKLPDSLLIRIGVGTARMERTAARAFVAMFAEARATLGVVIKHVGDYRSYDAQKNLFISRYQPVSMSEYNNTPSSRRKVWNGATAEGFNSIYWVKKLINGRYPATAATPGSSNHGWGLALDIAEEYDSDTAPDPIRQVFVQWLVNNAKKYGVSAELQSEPWHWRYVAGDNIPAAVRQFEAAGGTIPTSTTSTVTTSGPSLTFAYPGTPIKLGSKGDAVKLVQAVVGATPDGDFGLVTERRVKEWQSKNSLLADGIVGSVTWKKMFG
jgi:peptidoglycan hydrolase-like protein with peptidoglycan-binding domain